MAVRHPLKRLFPLPARHALLGDKLKAVAGGAEVERVVAAGSSRKVLGLLVARHELRCLCEGGIPWEKKGGQHQAGRWEHRPHRGQPTSTAMRCIGLPP